MAQGAEAEADVKLWGKGASRNRSFQQHRAGESSDLVWRREGEPAMRRATGTGLTPLRRASR
jgi:hypothetical protein